MKFEQNLPFNNAGRWSQEMDSIMNPGQKCTLPQYIAQKVLETRCKYLKDHPKITKGPGWSTAVSKQVRQLCQQAAVICNYLPHPDDDPLVIPTIKSYFTENRIFSIGQYRKTRVTKSGKLNITQYEKDVANGLLAKYNQLKTKKEKIVNSTPILEEITKVEPSKEQTTIVTNKKRGRLSNILDEE